MFVFQNELTCSTSSPLKGRFLPVWVISVFWGFFNTGKTFPLDLLHAHQLGISVLTKR